MPVVLFLKIGNRCSTLSRRRSMEPMRSVKSVMMMIQRDAKSSGVCVVSSTRTKHVLSRGQVRLCPFAQFSLANDEKSDTMISMTSRCNQEREVTYLCALSVLYTGCSRNRDRKST